MQLLIEVINQTSLAHSIAVSTVNQLAMESPVMVESSADGATVIRFNHVSIHQACHLATILAAVLGVNQIVITAE